MAVLPLTLEPGLTDIDVFGVYEALCDLWGLSIAARATLMDIPERTYYRWRETSKQIHLSADQRARVSYLVNIHLDLYALFDDEEQARKWMTRPSPAHAGQSPIDVLLHGNTPTHGTLIPIFELSRSIRRLAV